MAKILINNSDKASGDANAQEGNSNRQLTPASGQDSETVKPANIPSVNPQINTNEEQVISNAGEFAKFPDWDVVPQNSIINYRLKKKQ